MITLSKVAWLALKGMDLPTKDRVAAKMGITTNRLYYWIKTRSDNFTKAGNLAVLAEELGLDQSDLLETKLQQEAA